MFLDEADEGGEGLRENWPISNRVVGFGMYCSESKIESSRGRRIKSVSMI